MVHSSSGSAFQKKNLKALISFETSVLSRQTTRRHISKDIFSNSAVT